MFAPRNADCLVAVARQQPVDRLCRGQPAGRHANHLRIGCLADGEIYVRIVEIGDAAVEPCFRLRNVCRRNVAGVIALVGGLQDLAQELHVDALRFDQRLICNDAHVRGHRVEQHALFDAAQLFAARLHLRLGLSHLVSCLHAVEQGLVDGKPRRPRLEQGGRWTAYRRETDCARPANPCSAPARSAADNPIRPAECFRRSRAGARVPH